MCILFPCLVLMKLVFLVSLDFPLCGRRDEEGVKGKG